MEDKIQVDTYEGKPIFLENGWFVAQDGKMPVSSRTLDGIKKKLTVKAESVTVIYVHDDWDYGRRVAAIIKVVREKSGRLRNAENGVMIERFPTLYVLDPDVYAEIKLLERQRDSISDQISDAYSRLSRFR